MQNRENLSAIFLAFQVDIKFLSYNLPFPIHNQFKESGKYAIENVKITIIYFSIFIEPLPNCPLCASHLALASSQVKSWSHWPNAYSAPPKAENHN